MSTTIERPTPETDAELARILGSSEIFVMDEAPTLAVLTRRLERERDEKQDQITMMIEHDRQRLESDSVVASCDCLTKSPEVKYHKPGCKYRLICGRDEAREKFKATRRELTAANKGAERCSHINNSLAVSLHEVREALRNAEAELSVATAERDDYRRKVEAMRSAIKEADRVLSDFVGHIGECDERDLLRCDSDPHPPSVFSVYAAQASAALAKLRPLLKP